MSIQLAGAIERLRAERVHPHIAAPYWNVFTARHSRYGTSWRGRSPHNGTRQAYLRFALRRTQREQPAWIQHVSCDCWNF